MQAPTSTDLPGAPDAAPSPAPSVVARFAAWMTGSRAGGQAVLEAVSAEGGDESSRLASVLEVFVRRRRKGPGREDLDAVLRSDPTAVVDLEHPLVRGDVRRLNVLQRELQRTCLTTTLLNLPAAPRAAFILLEILGLPRELVAEIMGSAEALKTAHLRALRELDAYLGPRCEHMDPENPCHCATRLGVALDRGFVGWPERDDLASTPLEVRRHADVRALFTALPLPL